MSDHPYVGGFDERYFRETLRLVGAVHPAATPKEHG